MRCVCDALRECTIREDAASEYAQRGATHEGAEACDDAGTCEKDMGCGVGAERYEWSDFTCEARAVTADIVGAAPAELDEDHARSISIPVFR